MITEAVICVILHCSRCNKAFRDEVDDDFSGVAHWDNADDITDAFNKGCGEYGGWRQFGDRVVCSRCQVSGGDSEGFADDPDARENPRPLAAAEADKVARTQASYVSYAAVERVLHNAGKSAGPDDGWRHVTSKAGAA